MKQFVLGPNYSTYKISTEFVHPFFGVKLVSGHTLSAFGV